MVREKITNFIAASSFSPKISKLLNGVVRAILKGNPTETLKYLLPQTCERIEKIILQSDSVLTDHKGDTELTWCLTLFSELLRARGETLVPYKSMILSVFHQCVRIIHKGSYEAVANAAKNLLKSVTHVYPTDYRLTAENIDEPFTDFLPIRVSELGVCLIDPLHRFLYWRLGVSMWSSTSFKCSSMCRMRRKWTLRVNSWRRSSTLSCNCWMRTARRWPMMNDCDLCIWYVLLLSDAFAWCLASKVKKSLICKSILTVDRAMEVSGS